MENADPKIGREKYWSESDLEEKCKRLRTEVKKLQYLLSEQSILVKKLMKHNHLGNDIVAIIERERKFEGSRGLKGFGDDVYF